MKGKGRFHGKGRGYSGRGNDRSQNVKKELDPTVNKKTLSDYVYHVGMAKNASEFIEVTEYLMTHIRAEFKQGHYVAKALTKREQFDFSAEEPILRESTKKSEAIRARENRQYMEVFKNELDRFGKMKDQYKDSMLQAYGFLYKQCSPALQEELKGRTNFKSDIEDNAIELMKAIEEEARVIWVQYKSIIL